MNNIKSLMSFALAIIITQALYAENKARIYVTNNYGEDVSLYITWSSTSFMGVKSLSSLNMNRSSDVILKEHYINHEITAPLSAYKLYSIQATPMINDQGYIHNWNSSSDNNPPGIESSINRILNQDVVTNTKSIFFIIDRSNRPSAVAGKNKIIIKEYPNFEQYKRAVAMIERAQFPQSYQPAVMPTQVPEIRPTQTKVVKYTTYIEDDASQKEELKKILTDDFMQHYYGISSGKNSSDKNASESTGDIANVIKSNQNLLDSWQNKS